MAQLVLNDEIRTHPVESEEIRTAMNQLNMEDYDLPIHFSVRWEYGHPDRQSYRVTLSDAKSATYSSFGVMKDDLDSSRGLDRLRREFNWAVATFYQSRVKELIREQRDLESLAGIAE